MAAQPSGTGALTELGSEQFRKNDVLSDRDKTMRNSDKSLDETDVQIDEYKDITTNQRPAKDDRPEEKIEKASETDEQVNRPGFDLGGATGNTEAGKGLGMGTDAKEGREDWGLPR